MILYVCAIIAGVKTSDPVETKIAGVHKIVRKKTWVFASDRRFTR